MRLPYIETFAGVSVSAAVLCYSHIGSPQLDWNQEEITQHAEAPEGMSLDYYEILDTEQTRETEQFKALQSFASNLLGNVKDMDPDFSKTVDDHFWDLV